MRNAQLMAFHWVAAERSFSRAAGRMALTQPAVSDHVLKLEEAYGVQLFQRTPRGAELTEMGRKLFAITERLVEAQGQARELLSRARTVEEGQFTIGADAAVHVLPELAAFRARYPRITVRLVTGNSAELLARLESFAIDVVVTAERPRGDQVLARKLRTHPLVAVARRKGTRLGSRLRFAQLAELPLILREDGSATRKLLLDEAQRRGLALAPAMEIESREAAREAVAQGLGVAVMSAGELAPDPRLRTLRFIDWDVAMEEWLTCLRSRAGLHVIRAFLDLLPDRADQATGVHRT
jgi:LysR family transcriptional regulator, low CO2-responsive transcriptional regulator